MAQPGITITVGFNFFPLEASILPRIRCSVRQFWCWGNSTCWSVEALTYHGGFAQSISSVGVITQ